MKTYLVRLSAIGVLGLVSLATGCVSDAQYKEALAAARRANEQLVTCQSALRDLRSENQRLLADIQARDGVIAAKDKQLATLQAAYDELGGKYKDLLDKYQKELGRIDVVQPMGNIVLPPELDKALREFAAANPDILEYLPQYGMVKFKSDLTFAPGSVDIQKSAGDALRRFVEILNTPAAAKFHVYIAGHTDDMPIVRPQTKREHPTNWYLSVHRSVAVQTVMSAAGLAPARAGVMGFSEYHPVAANPPGHKGNQANRRVEIWIVPPDRFLTATGN
jgi:chemotaxis protein MotB